MLWGECSCISLRVAVTISSLRYCSVVRGVDVESRLRSFGPMFLVGPEGCSCVGGFDSRDMFAVTSLMCGVGKGWVMCGE